MTGVPLEHSLILAGMLFSLGLVGVLVRRNLIFILMSLEVMLNSTAIVFVAAGAHYGQPDGQVMFLLVLTLAAAEVAIGLALVMQVFRHFRTVDADALSDMRG